MCTHIIRKKNGYFPTCSYIKECWITCDYSLKLFSKTSEGPICSFIPLFQTFLLLLLMALLLREMSIIAHMCIPVFMYSVVVEIYHLNNHLICQGSKEKILCLLTLNQLQQLHRNSEILESIKSGHSIRAGDSWPGNVLTTKI